ncbi:hypothetical protein C8R42DRAFT_780060 [Lentinula raphanica]|nr:hypothetical protein C8R42DRAFT_780060 [Lentinula raphanica]
MVQVFESDSSLSTNRINRFLRPLRNKCSALASLDVRPGSNCTATYSTSKNFAQPTTPPLYILLPPENCARLDAATTKLAERIYAVRNAFKDIVEKTEALRIQAEGNYNARLPSMSTLCAFIIGQHAEPDIAVDVTRLEEERTVEVVEDLYEKIPASYRGSTLVSHALTLILNDCPPSPTLYKLLLDITLQLKLVYHSEVLLHKLLLIAFSAPLPNRSPPICHPAHSNFLVELLSRWEQKDNPPCVFFRILNEVMTTLGTFDSWVCKATTKLLLLDCRKDPLRLATVSANLVHFISKPYLHRPSRQFSVNTTARTSPCGTLRRLLRYWLEFVLDYLLCNSQAVDLHGLYDFLLTCEHCWAHLTEHIASSAILPSPEQDVASTIVSVTTLLFSQGLLAGQTALIQMLSEDIRSSTSLLSPLISRTLVVSDQLSDCSERIQMYAASLRKQGFLELEVSLWASALRELENFEPLLKRFDKDSLTKYRNVLIECVEDAEQRCYGHAVDVSNSPFVRQHDRWKDAGIRRGSTQPTKRSRVDENQHYTLHRSSNSNDCESPQPRKRPRPEVHRVPSFASLLSNALSNHVILHRGTNSKADDLTNYRLDTENADTERPMCAGIEDLSGERFESIIPSSDDLLAYATSPIRG